MTLSPERNPTIEDVAAAAGVSRAAVSKVLRNAYGVSDGMRERVNRAMTELNYRPRLAARAMRGRTFTLGIEIPDFGNQFFARLIMGASAAIADGAYQLVLSPAEPGSREGLKAIQALVDRQVDGLIVVSPRVDRNELERIASSTPVVMLGRHDSTTFYDTVVGDDLAGAGAVMAHLISLGHRRIAHLTIDEASETDASPHGIRLRTYLEQMRAHGLADDIHVIHSDEGQEAASHATRGALSHDSPFTALFAAHDELALGAQRAAAELGARIAIVGYDDVPIASHPAIGLTTVRQHGVEMGIRAAELLLERINGRTEPVTASFTPELIVRASSLLPPE